MARKLVRTLLMGCILMVGAPLPTHAQEGPPSGEPRPQRRERISLLEGALDTNKDRELSAEEIKTASISIRLLDLNKNGKLEANELRPPAPPIGPTVAEMVSRLMEFDGNANGTLSPDEVPDQLSSLFTDGDTDHDKVLTSAELTVLVEKQNAEAEKRAASQPAPLPRPGGRPQRIPLLQAALDLDGDGILSQKEITVAAESLLRLDTNRDGKLDAMELRPAPTAPETPPVAPPASVP